MHDYFVLLGYLGSAIGACVVVPQILRIVRNPGAAGVAASTWGFTALACSLWLTYGIRTGAMPQVPGNVLLITGAVAIVLLVPHTWSPKRRGVALTAVVATSVLALAALPAAWVGYTAFALGLCSVWPQVVTSVGTYRAAAVSAVSVGSLSLKIGSQACWLSYAIGTSDRAVTLAALMALSTAVLIVCLELAARSRGARPVVLAG